MDSEDYVQYVHGADSISRDAGRIYYSRGGVIYKGKSGSSPSEESDRSRSLILNPEGHPTQVRALILIVAIYLVHHKGQCPI